MKVFQLIMLLYELGNYISVILKPFFKKKKDELINVQGHVYCLRTWLIFLNLISNVLFFLCSLFSPGL